MQINTEFVTEGLPPLPDTPQAMHAPQQPVPPQQFTGQQQIQPTNGIPIFEVRPVRRKSGEGYTFENVEFVRVLTPGDTKASPEHKVTDALREKYRPWYEAWRRGVEARPQGVPIEMWPAITPAQAMHLKTLNIFTVEQIAEVPDANLHQIPMGLTLKQNARKFIEDKADADAISRRDAENAAMKDGMAAMEQRMAELTARLDAETQARQEAEARAVAASVAEPESAAPVEVETKADEPKRKPGRPRKDAG